MLFFSHGLDESADIKAEVVVDLFLPMSGGPRTGPTLYPQHFLKKTKQTKLTGPPLYP
jgi:hypothetical protein